MSGQVCGREAVTEDVGHELQSLILGVTLLPPHQSLPSRIPVMQVSRVQPMSSDDAVTEA